MIHFALGIDVDGSCSVVAERKVFLELRKDDVLRVFERSIANAARFDFGEHFQGNVSLTKLQKR